MTCRDCRQLGEACDVHDRSDYLCPCCGEYAYLSPGDCVYGQTPGCQECDARTCDGCGDIGHWGVGPDDEPECPECCDERRREDERSPGALMYRRGA